MTATTATWDEPVTSWILFFQGFLQDEGGRTTLERVHRRVNQRCSGPNTIISIGGWRDNVSDKARRIANWRDEQTGDNPRVVIVGFSYGGWSATRVCVELQKHDMPVEALLLCDPVGRFFGHLPSSFSMLDVIPIRVPANVRKLYTWRQKANYPRGGRIVLEKPYAALSDGKNDGGVNCGTSWIEDKIFHFVPHESMDDHPDFQRTILQIACPRGVVEI